MIKKQQNSVWVLFMIFGLAVVVALFMFQPKLTGNAIIGQYTDQTSCEAANYTWEVLTEQQCTPENCVPCTEGCQATCQTCEGGTCSDSTFTDQTACEAAQGTWTPQCTDIPDCVLCAEGCQSCTCEDVVTGGQCVGEFCGDGVLNGNEACDGTDLGNHSCSEQSFASGSLTCNADCTLNVAQCCMPEWNPSAWSECSNGVKTRTIVDEHNCGVDYVGSLSLSDGCSEETSTTITTTPTPTTTAPTTTQTTATICSAAQETCSNGGLYACNAEGTAWDLKEACELGCADNKCIVKTEETTSTPLAGSVVKGQSGKEFFTTLYANFSSNKTRMYLILGGVVILAAGLVSYLVFFKKKMRK